MMDTIYLLERDHACRVLVDTQDELDSVISQYGAERLSRHKPAMDIVSLPISGAKVLAVLREQTARAERERRDRASWEAMIDAGPLDDLYGVLDFGPDKDEYQTCFVVWIDAPERLERSRYMISERITAYVRELAQRRQPLTQIDKETYRGLALHERPAQSAVTRQERGYDAVRDLHIAARRERLSLEAEIAYLEPRLAREAAKDAELAEERATWDRFRAAEKTYFVKGLHTDIVQAAEARESRFATFTEVLDWARARLALDGREDRWLTICAETTERYCAVADVSREQIIERNAERPRDLRIIR